MCMSFKARKMFAEIMKKSFIWFNFAFPSASFLASSKIEFSSPEGEMSEDEDTLPIQSLKT